MEMVVLAVQGELAVQAAEETASTGMVLLGLQHTLMEREEVVLGKAVKVEIVEREAQVAKVEMEAMAVVMKQMVLTEIQEIQVLREAVIPMVVEDIQAAEMVRQALAVVVREMERPELPMVAVVQ